jgi:hypothetical protein
MASVANLTKGATWTQEKGANPILQPGDLATISSNLHDVLFFLEGASVGAEVLSEKDARCGLDLCLMMAREAAGVLANELKR